MLKENQKPYTKDYFGNKVGIGDIILYPQSNGSCAPSFAKAIFCHVSLYTDNNRRGPWNKDRQYKTFTKVAIERFGNSIYSVPRKSNSTVPFIKITEEQLTDEDRKYLEQARQKAGV